MSTVLELIEKLESDGIRVTANGDRLRVESSSPLAPEIRDSLKSRKREILNHLTIIEGHGKDQRPFLDGNNDLVIPFCSEPKYHWWAGGKDLKDIMVYLNRGNLN